MNINNKEFYLPEKDNSLKKKPGRIGWIDAAKGVGITLVVFGHILGGAISRNWFGHEQQGQSLYEFIYLFHMPLFFLISGMVWIESAKANPLGSIINSIRTIAWPFVFWSLVQQLSTPIISKFAPNTTSLEFNVWLEYLITGKVFWFLWTLLIIQVCIAPIARIPTGILFAGSLLIFALTINSDPFGTFSPVFRNLPFFLAGTLLAPVLLRFDYSKSLSSSLKLLIGCLALFALLFSLKFAGLNPPNLTYLIGGFIGSFGLILGVLSLNSLQIQSALQTIGAASLGIYVSHAYFQGASREILVRLIGLHPYLIVLLVTLAAIIGPLIIWISANKYGFGWIYRFPKFKKVNGKSN
jgi:fucose 4-O-acetylase-like acetyltransferase